jgi:aspartyl aminopeptidase
MSATSPLTGLGSFLVASPTPYQMCSHASKRLLAAGFTELKEEEHWAGKSALRKGGRYFFTRAASTLVAFSIGGAFEPGNGFKVVGAHTDSPVLKVKPVSKKTASGYQQLGVECYGGGQSTAFAIVSRQTSLANATQSPNAACNIAANCPFAGTPC